jgi:regulator of nonsense transcripts 2
MKSQQQADREEQQRIKSLVLNYEMANDNEESDGNDDRPLNHLFPVNRNLGLERRQAPPPRDTRFDKPGSHRGTFRSKKLQLSDVNW